MHVLYVTGSYWPAVSRGGPASSLRRLCVEMRAAGHRVSVLTTDSDGVGRLGIQSRGWQEVDGLPVFYGHRIARPDFSTDLLKTLRRLVPTADVVHATGTYNWFLPLTARFCAVQRVPLVLSPRGSLLGAARARSGLTKRLYDWTMGDRALGRVTTFHATSREEADAIRERLPRADVSVVPNGVDLPIRDSLRKVPAGDEGFCSRYLLYLGRVHPYKRIDLIIEAFSAAANRRDHASNGADPAARSLDGQKRDISMPTAVELWIAGSAESAHEAYLRRVARRCGVGDRVRFLGQVSGEEKSRLLTSALGLLLASASESFGMSVAEALAHATPCVVTRTAPWSGLETHGCGFWVDDNVAALAAGIRELACLSDQNRQAMGTRGRAWMGQDFAWSAIGERMAELYRHTRDISGTTGAH